MQGRLSQAVGIAALLQALLSAGTVLLLLAASVGVRLRYPAFWSNNLGSIYLVGSLLVILIAAGLWRMEGSGFASTLLAVAAAIAGVDLIAIVAFTWGAPAIQTLMPAMAQPLTWLGLIGALCLGAGLLLGTTVPSWLGWAAILAALCHAAANLLRNSLSFVLSGASLSISGLFTAVGAVAYEVLLIGLCVVLLMRASSPEHASNKRIERTPGALS